MKKRNLVKKAGPNLGICWFRLAYALLFSPSRESFCACRRAAAAGELGA